MLPFLYIGSWLKFCVAKYLYSYHSSNYCESNRYHSFLLLKATAKSKGKLIAIIIISTFTNIIFTGATVNSSSDKQIHIILKDVKPNEVAKVLACVKRLASRIESVKFSFYDEGGLILSKLADIKPEWTNLKYFEV